MKREFIGNVKNLRSLKGKATIHTDDTKVLHEMDNHNHIQDLVGNGSKTTSLNLSEESVRQMPSVALLKKLINRKRSLGICSGVRCYTIV